ncbi:MAG: class I SAM-dependent methyltransferase [Candidatus Eutrophobiaceae bacterium]
MNSGASLCRKDLDGGRYLQIPDCSSAPLLPKPCKVLRDCAHLLPVVGNALDLACGRGGNAMFMAERGLITEAWDLSAPAINGLGHWAQERNVPLTARLRDVCANPPVAHCFDVIAVSHFLDRGLCQAIAAALRSSGLLYYQTFTRIRPPNAKGPANTDYLLETGELPSLFHNLKIRYYREDALCGDIERGERNLAFLVAQK